MLGGLILAAVLVLVLPVSFLISGGVGSAVMGWLLKNYAEETHPGSELLKTNY